MRTQRLVGAVSRALPRGHNPFDRWLSRHPGDREVTYRDIDGLWRTADLRDDLERGLFAGIPTGLPPDILRRIPTGTPALDIGANVGTVAGQLAVQVTALGRVWAIEPLPRNVSRLEEFAARNQLPIDVVAVAAGQADGELALRLAGPEHSGWASATATWNVGGEVTVAVRSVDSLVQERAHAGPSPS